MTVILYDLPSKDPCKSWSLNPWKTRMALNFKGVDYETKWIEYPDVAPTFEKFGIPPNKEGTAYTIPTACIDDKYIMDSWNIAQALEARNPSPSMHLDDPMVQRVFDVGMPAIGEMRYIFMPIVPENVLNEKSKGYFYETRAQRFGVPLTEFQKHYDMEAQWEKATAGLVKVADLLKEKPGPYFLGDTPSYADFVVVSFFHFCRRVDDSIFYRVMNADRSFGDLYKACEKWLVRDDH